MHRTAPTNRTPPARAGTPPSRRSPSPVAPFTGTHAPATTIAATAVTIASLAATVAAIGCLAAPAALAGQQTVRPGDPSLRLENLRERVDSTRVWRISGEERRKGPLQIQTVERIEDRGEELLRVTFTLESERGGLYDTTTLRLPSLAPVAHKSRPAPGGPWRSLDVTYGDGTIAGTVAPPDSAARSFEVAVREPVFDPGVMNVLFAVLPLEVGYEARIPVFSHEAREVEHHGIRVTGEGERPFRGDTVEVWEVEMVLPSGPTFRASIDKETGKLVRGEVRLGPEMRVVTTPPGS